MKQPALARLALLALIWGSAFLWIKLAIRGFSPVEITFLRLALGAAVLFPIVLARREVLPRSARMWAHIAVAALLLTRFRTCYSQWPSRPSLRPRPGSSTRPRRYGR